MSAPFQTALRHHHAGRMTEAERLYREILKANPNHADSLHHLGLIAHRFGHFQAAADLIEKAIRLDEGNKDARFNLSLVLMHFATAMKNTGEIDGAIAALRRAISVRPDFAEAFSDLGNALAEAGQTDGALAAYRSAIRINPQLHGAHSNLIFTLHYVPDVSAAAITAEQDKWNRKFAGPLLKKIPVTRGAPHRRVRVGYVSGDFRDHPVGRFLEPLFASHDKTRFELFAYANSRVTDAVTKRLEPHADHWNKVADLSDPELAYAIRRDEIDILVDLALHSHGNRLLALAEKPAPVQVSWLGYPGTTGLDAIDYWLSDPHLSPPDKDEFAGAGVIRLHETYWCYQPHPAATPVVPSPMIHQGRVTFGCLNNFSKVSQPAVMAWIDILRTVPGSHFVLHVKSKTAQQKLAQQCEAAGIDRLRLEFTGNLPIGEYFQLYDRIDIALDSFPFNGATTTCDALWMGVPVVSLTGKIPVARSGLSILSNAGLPQMACNSIEAYIRCAVGLAGDAERLLRMRSSLRQQMQQSPLMDAPRFARSIEAAFDQMRSQQ